VAEREDPARSSQKAPGGEREDQSIAAVVLAGGQARRLGGADKPGISIGGRTLVSLVVDAAAQAGAGRIVVVGPSRPGLATPGATIEFTRERPPGGGPVPALRAGLRLVTESWLLLLAADVPFLRARHLRALLLAARPSGRAVLADDHGRPQWLCGCWRAADLRLAMTGYLGGSLRGALEPLRPVLVGIEVTATEPPPWLDCDSPPDIAAARAWSD
jgi:molybdopterin-guanine dinucleotide biosynthesis protein A